MSTKTEGDKANDKSVPRPRRERLPDTRQSVTHKFNVNGHEGYVTVGLYEDGRPGELFITMAKEGSTIGGLMDSFGTAVSMSLQYGVPLEVLVNKFSHTRFEPMGYTTNPEIRIAKSLVDYIFRWLAYSFLAGYREASNGTAATSTKEVKQPESKSTTPKSTPSKAKGSTTKPTSNGHPASDKTNGSVANGNGKSTEDVLDRAGLVMKADSESSGDRDGQFARFQSDAPSCDNCGAITVRNGNCYLCHNCGNSMGCS